MAVGLSAAVAALALSGCFDTEEMPTCKVDAVTVHGNGDLSFGLITTNEESADYSPESTSWIYGDGDTETLNYGEPARHNFLESGLEADEFTVQAFMNMKLASDEVIPSWGKGNGIQCTSFDVGVGDIK